MLVLALALAGCGRQASAPPPLAGAKLGGAFVLTDENGKRFDSRTLAGRYPVFYFGYTFCPDVCPTDMAMLGQGLRTFEARNPAAAAKVQPIFITVDPARDTPAVLKQFTAAFHPRLLGLTGTPAEIDRVAKLFAVTHGVQPPVPGTKGYLVEHSRVTMLFGPDMQPLALLPTDESADAVAAELAKWVK